MLTKAAEVTIIETDYQRGGADQLEGDHRYTGQSGNHTRTRATTGTDREGCVLAPGVPTRELREVATDDQTQAAEEGRLTYSFYGALGMFWPAACSLG